MRSRPALPALLLVCALALGGCQTTAANGEPGDGGWSGLINPNKARDLAAAAAQAVRKGGSILAGNYTPAKETHEIAKSEVAEHDDPYIAACTVQKGTTSFSNGWMDFASAGFTIRKGEEKTVSLAPKQAASGASAHQTLARHSRRPRAHTAGLNAGFWVTREKEGQNLIFCAEDPEKAAHHVAGAQNDCVKVVVMEDYLSHGITRTLDIPGAVRGGTIACGYEQPQFAEKTD